MAKCLAAVLLFANSVQAAADVAVIVSAQSPITALTRSELADIFLGRTTRLQDGARVVPIDQAEGSPARAEFYERYLQRSLAQVKQHWSKLIFTGRGRPPRTVRDSAAAITRIAADPAAVGYAERLAADKDERVRVVTIE